VAGVAYEALRVADAPRAGRWVRPLLAPGLALQRVTTRPPTDDQVEVAIAAVRAALRTGDAVDGLGGAVDGLGEERAVS
jgi:uncharacterized protein YqhQ